MLNDKILVKETFNILDGPIQIKKGEIWWGRWKYTSSYERDEKGNPLELPLVVICSSTRGPYLIKKDFLELADQTVEINT